MEADGGNININVPYMISMIDSTVTSSVGGGPETTGGNINIDPEYFTMKESSIIANALRAPGEHQDRGRGLSGRSRQRHRRLFPEGVSAGRWTSSPDSECQRGHEAVARGVFQCRHPAARTVPGPLEGGQVQQLRCRRPGRPAGRTGNLLPAPCSDHVESTIRKENPLQSISLCDFLFRIRDDALSSAWPRL